MKLLGWAVVVVLILLAVNGSTGTRHMRDGDTGSFMGRQVADSSARADRAKTLTDRGATQRY
jgi:hypothetical protein